MAHTWNSKVEKQIGVNQGKKQYTSFSGERLIAKGQAEGRKVRKRVCVSEWGPMLKVSRTCSTLGSNVHQDEAGWGMQGEIKIKNAELRARAAITALKCTFVHCTRQFWSVICTIYYYLPFLISNQHYYQHLLRTPTMTKESLVWLENLCALSILVCARAHNILNTFSQFVLLEACKQIVCKVEKCVSLDINLITSWQLSVCKIYLFNSFTVCMFKADRLHTCLCGWWCHNGNEGKHTLPLL